MIPSDARVWIAMGHTDMRKGFDGLEVLVQQGLGRDPHGGDLYVFRGRARSLCKIIWHDDIGMSLYAKRLEFGRFIWPSAKDGRVSLSRATGLLARRRRLTEPSGELASSQRGVMTAGCAPGHLNLAACVPG